MTASGGARGDWGLAMGGEVSVAHQQRGVDRPVVEGRLLVYWIGWAAMVMVVLSEGMGSLISSAVGNVKVCVHGCG